MIIDDFTVAGCQVATPARARITAVSKNRYFVSCGVKKHAVASVIHIINLINDTHLACLFYLVIKIEKDINKRVIDTVISAAITSKSARIEYASFGGCEVESGAVES